MFITVLFTIAKIWTQPKCPSVDEWIQKKWYIYTMGQYSAMGKEDILSYATWMALGHPRDQTEKDKFCMILLIRGL